MKLFSNLSRRLITNPIKWLIRKFINWLKIKLIESEELRESNKKSGLYRDNKFSPDDPEEKPQRIYDWIKTNPKFANNFNPYSGFEKVTQKAVLFNPTGNKQKALQFDSDFQPQFPVYYNPSLINYYVIRLQDYYSYLASLQVCNPLSRSMSYINQECYHASASIYDGEDNKLEWNEIATNPKLAFFDDSSSSIAWKDFVSLINTHYFVCGNVYIVPDDPLRGGGFKRFTALPPQYVTIELGMDGQPKYYRYRPGCGATLSVGQTQNGQSVAQDRRDLGVYTELIILPEDIIHIKRYQNSLLPIYGIGIVESSEPLFQRYLQHNRLMEHYTDQAMQPCGILTSVSTKDGSGVLLNADDAIKWSERMNALYAGKSNAGKLMVAPTGFDYKQLEIISLEELREQKRDIDIEIFTLFNLPCSFWAIDGKDLPRFGNLEAQIQTFRETVLKEILDVHTIIGNRILEMQGLDNEYSFSYSNAQSYQASPQLTKDWMAGMLKRDEARKFVGMEAVGGEEGEAYYVRETATANDVDEIGELKGEVDLLKSLVEKGGPGSGRYPAGSGAAGVKEPPVPYRDTMGRDAAFEGFVDYYQSQGDIPGGLNAAWRDVASRQGRVPTNLPTMPTIPPLPKASEHMKEEFLKYQPREKSWRDTNAGGWISKPEKEVWKRREIPGNKDRIIKDLHRLQAATKERHSSKLQHPVQKFLHEQLARVMKAVEDHKDGYEALVSKYPKDVVEKAKDKKSQDVKKFQQDLFKLDEENKLLAPIISNAYKGVASDTVGNIASTLTLSVDPETVHAVTQKINLVAQSRAPMVNTATQEKLEGFIRDSVDNNYSWGELANNIYHGYAGDVHDYVDRNGEVYRSIDDSASLHDRAELIAQTETRKAVTEASANYYKSSTAIKTWQIYGCNEPPDNEWCNRKGITRDELDDIDQHPRCQGVLVPDTFDENFGED
jgi:phage portal protein BeeE